jgi:hypothetical protein
MSNGLAKASGVTPLSPEKSSEKIFLPDRGNSEFEED